MDTKWALYGTLGIGLAAYNSVFIQMMLTREHLRVSDWLKPYL